MWYPNCISMVMAKNNTIFIDLARPDLACCSHHIFIAPSHPQAEATKLLCPHHKGAGSPHPIRVRA